MILRLLSFTAIILNSVAMIAWFLLNPPATYERLAHRDLKEAHDAVFRKVSAEQSYAMYHHVAEKFKRSTFAEEARYFAARTALMGLGQFADAERQLASFVESKPKNEEHLAAAQEHLKILRSRSDIPETSRDEVLWEYIQAINEEGSGKLRESLTRLEWIVENFGTSALGQLAEPMRQKVSAKITGS